MSELIVKYFKQHPRPLSNLALRGPVTPGRRPATLQGVATPALHTSALETSKIRQKLPVKHGKVYIARPRAFPTL